MDDSDSIVREFYYCTPDRKTQIMTQIEQMEQADMVSRGVRESLLVLSVLAAESQGISEADLYANNIAYKKFKDRDNEIRALRAEFLALGG